MNVVAITGAGGMIGRHLVEALKPSARQVRILLDHLREIVGGSIVWAPGLKGGAVLSTRGGDFLFESGEDLSIGYRHHDDDAVHLYLEESFSFRVATPEAAVALSP
jgi:uncharacterized linocin/CFP29 family protein